MKYAILMYADPEHTKAMPAAELEAVASKHRALVSELLASGELINGAGLAFPEDTRVFRLRDGAPQAGSGPVAAGEIHLTAYYIVECAEPERAAEIAQRVLDSHVTAVEVRAIHDSVGMDVRARQPAP